MHSCMPSMPSKGDRTIPESHGVTRHSTNFAMHYLVPSNQSDSSGPMLAYSDSRTCSHLDCVSFNGHNPLNEYIVVKYVSIREWRVEDNDIPGHWGAEEAEKRVKMNE